MDTFSGDPDMAKMKNLLQDNVLVTMQGFAFLFFAMQPAALFLYERIVSFNQVHLEETATQCGHILKMEDGGSVFEVIRNFIFWCDYFILL